MGYIDRHWHIVYLFWAIKIRLLPFEGVGIIDNNLLCGIRHG